MITVISGTNRLQNQSLIFAQQVLTELDRQTDEGAALLDLCRLDGDPVLHAGYRESDQSAVVRDIQEWFILPASRFYFVVPEYNGSFPGILKYLLDAISVRQRHASFGGKKAAILGISSGRAGNLRGMDHLTSILHYLNVAVLPNRLPVSRIEGLLSGKGQIETESARLIRDHVTEFLQF